MVKCRNCALYALEDVLSKNGRVLSDRMGRCLWESTEPLPIALSYGRDKRPQAGRAEPNEEHECPCFKDKSA